LGMGEGKVRYRSSFSPKNRSGSGEVVSAGTFPPTETSTNQYNSLFNIFYI
jgi:hypothetical protein